MSEKITFRIIVYHKPVIYLKISEKHTFATSGLICIKRKQCGNRRHLVRWKAKPYNKLSTVTMYT